MEHGIYICSWSRSTDGFALWLTERPHIRGEAVTYAEAEKLLIQAIQDAGGAMQAVLEFVPPLPKSDLETKYTNPELYLIGGDDRFETDSPRAVAFETAEEREGRFKWADSFFESPICRKCAFAASRRGARPLFMEYVPRRYDGAFGNVGHEGTTSLQILSEEFLDLLTTDERGRLRLQAVTGKGRASKFYELVGPTGPPLVAVAGMKISGWRCTACDHRTWGYWIKGISINSFVAKTDLPPSLRGVFTIGGPPEVQLAVTATRWKGLVGKRGTRGFVSRLLGVVPDHELDRHPELPTYEEELQEGGRTSRSS
jgi:hypothetical protein